MKDNAMSEIVGAIILVALVIVGISVVGLYLTSSPPPQSIAKAVMSGQCTRCDSQYYAVMISHEGGENIDPATLRYFVDTRENPGILHEVYISDFFDGSEQDLAALDDEICKSPDDPTIQLKPKNQMGNIQVGDAARIWFDMKDFNWEKPRGVQIWTADKRYETSLKVPEFKVIENEKDFVDPAEYTNLHPPEVQPEETGGTGGTGGPSEPADPSAIIPVYVDGSVCKCRSTDYDDGKKVTCVAQFTYRNEAGVQYEIPIRESSLPWNEFTGSGMVQQFRCQPTLFKAVPDDSDKFWTNRFWNNIKWKLGHEMSALVKCEKSTPWCDDIIPGGSDAVCNYCADGVTY